MKCNVRALRVAAGLSQLELAERIGCTQGRISEYESGKHQPSRERAQRIMAECGSTKPEKVQALVFAVRLLCDEQRIRPRLVAAMLMQGR